MKARNLLILVPILSVLIAFLFCQKRPSPFQDTSNAEITLVIPPPPDTGYMVGDTARIGAALNLAHLVDSVNITLGDFLWDTTEAIGAQARDKDTVWANIPLLQPGTDTIIATMYLEDGAMREQMTAITVRGLPITFASDLPGQAGGRVGEACTLTVAVTGSGPFTYAWFKDGVAIAGKTSDTLLFTSLQPADSAEYYCVITDVIGKTATSRAALIIVRPLDSPDPPATLVIAEDTDYYVKIVWTSVPGAVAYNVYKDSVNLGLVPKLTQITDTSIIIEHNSKPCYIWVTTVTTSESKPSMAVFWEPRTNRLYPPENLSVVRIDSMHVRVKWDSVSIATGYLVFHNANRTVGSYTATGTASDTILIHETAFRYYYYVKAINATDTSLASDTVQTVDSMVIDTTVHLDCIPLLPGTSINDKIVEIAQSTAKTGCLMPQPGLYDNKMIRVYGKLQIVIQ